MELNVIEQSDTLSHVALKGRLDIAGVQKIEMPFTVATAMRHKATILDLQGVDFIASLGMGMLVDAAKTLKRNKTGVVLVNVQPLVQEALVAARLSDILPMFDSVDEAKKHLGVA